MPRQVMAKTTITCAARMSRGLTGVVRRRRRTPFFPVSGHGNGGGHQSGCADDHGGKGRYGCVDHSLTAEHGCWFVAGNTAEQE